MTDQEAKDIYEYAYEGAKLAECDEADAIEMAQKAVADAIIDEVLKEEQQPRHNPYDEGFRAGFDNEMNGGDARNPYEYGTSMYSEWQSGYSDGGLES